MKTFPVQKYIASLNINKRDMLGNRKYQAFWHIFNEYKYLHGAVNMLIIVTLFKKIIKKLEFYT